MPAWWSSPDIDNRQIHDVSLCKIAQPVATLRKSIGCTGFRRTHFAPGSAPARLLFGENDFDGVDFSAVIHLKSGDPRTESAEFFFPFRTMRCFASYDCTGQQLIDSGTVVINGERSALDLQVAEGKN